MSRIITVGNVVGECICGTDPCSGLDCGPYLPGEAPRKKMAPKSAAEMAAIRARPCSCGCGGDPFICIESDGS